jgi:hypothetical protein
MTAPADPSPAPAQVGDILALILGALAFGISLGVGLLSLVTWLIRTLQASDLTLAQPQRGFTARLLPVIILGTLGAIVAAGTATWSLLSPIDNPWRKAMLSVIAGAGSFVVALVTWPVDRSFGRPGLLALAGLAALGCLLIGRRLPRARMSA